MGRMFLTSWTAFGSAGLRVVLILAWAGVGCGFCAGGEMAGVLVSDHEGQGGHAAGAVELLVREKSYLFYYGEPLKRYFRIRTCSDIGAVWRVHFRVLSDGSAGLLSVTCSGQFDASLHGAWLAVVAYLKAAESSRLSQDLLSSRWRASPGFGEYLKKWRGLGMSFYNSDGRCLDALGGAGSSRVQLRAGADCNLGLPDFSADLLFDVMRRPVTRQWEIDNIRFE
jgi:hypothetical protein